MTTYIDLRIIPLMAFAASYFAGLIAFESAVVLMLVLGLQKSGFVE